MVPRARSSRANVVLCLCVDAYFGKAIERLLDGLNEAFSCVLRAAGTPSCHKIGKCPCIGGSLAHKEYKELTYVPI